MGGDWDDLGIRGELHRRHLPFVREPRGNHGGKGFDDVVTAQSDHIHRCFTA